MPPKKKKSPPRKTQKKGNKKVKKKENKKGSKKENKKEEPESWTWWATKNIGKGLLTVTGVGLLMSVFGLRGKKDVGIHDVLEKVETTDAQKRMISGLLWSVGNESVEQFDRKLNRLSKSDRMKWFELMNTFNHMRGEKPSFPDMMEEAGLTEKEKILTQYISKLSLPEMEKYLMELPGNKRPMINKIMSIATKYD